jgi:biopolymer transport protein ExbD
VWTTACGGGSAIAPSAVPSHPGEWPLPISSCTTPAPDAALVVVLSRKGLSLGKDGALLASVDPDATTWSQGFGTPYKPHARNDLELVPLTAALQAAYPDGNPLPTAAIAADPSVPYRMVEETLYTLGQRHVTSAVLLARAGSAIPFTFDVSPLAEQVRHGPCQSVPGEAPPLCLHVIITDGRSAGFVISAAGRQVGPGCQAAPGFGAAVPKRGGAFDFAGLSACAATLKGSDARLAAETYVTVTADGGVDVQTVVSTIDALRGSDGRLFADVRLGVPLPM